MRPASVIPFPATSTAAAAEWPGDEAFRGFYATTARPLWSYLRASCGNAALADDLLQESYLRLLSADLAHEEDSGRRAYLYRIATNLLRDHWRRGQRRPEPSSAAGEDAFTEITPAAGAGPCERLDVRRALAKLAPRDRQLLWLAHVEGASHRELASILGLGATSVRVLLFRARRRLAAALETRETSP
jgi:RNA polymerase sigma-70 factor, ECF subfamily